MTGMNQSGDAYFMFHQHRYEHLIQLVRELKLGPSDRCLDVGPSDLTSLLEEALGGSVDTLGLEADANSIERKHFHLDLNECQRVKDCRRDLGPYKLIVIAEVVEHLYTSPFLVLAYLRSLLVPGGHIIVQTPNAAALENRLLLLFGRNPYPLIEFSRHGHYRELTAKELRMYARQLEMSVETLSMHRYFDARFRKRSVGGKIQHASPNWFSYLAAAGASLAGLVPSFRPGISCVLRKRM